MCYLRPEAIFVKNFFCMNTIMDRLRPIFLYIVLLNAGLYAGLHFDGILDPSTFGVINFKGELMPSVEWAKRWKIVDSFMSVRMAIFGPIILWSYVITILIFVKRWKSLGFWLLEAAFGLFITDVLLRSFKLQSIVTLRNLISIMLPSNKQKWWVKCPTKSSRTSVIRSGFLH